MSAATRRQPSDASRTHVAVPMPPAAPVTTATFPFSPLSTEFPLQIASARYTSDIVGPVEQEPVNAC